MRKQTKLVAVLSAAALLAMGASMTSFAGWEKDDDNIYHYYDADGEMVTDEWKKDEGKWFYLNEDGDMLTNSWVDDEYYVDDHGAMVVNGWVKTYSDEDQDDPDEDGEHWYYFGSKGKKVTDDTKKINGKTYLFDEDGQMQYGWQEIDGQGYYFGGEDEGWRAESQWLWLERSGLVDEDEDEQDQVLGCVEDNDICDDEGWYWFQSSGKIYKDTAKKKINGRYYMFNEHGQMLYEWINSNKVNKPGSNAQLDGDATVTASASEMLYYNVVEEGWRGDGWYEIDGAKDMGADNDTDWYYIDDGEITYANKTTDAAGITDDNDPVYVMRKKIKASGNKYFAFNEKGQMQTGLQYVNDDGGFYFFDENGYQKTGKVSEVECEDDDYSFYFTTTNGKNGLGYTGEKDNYLYFNGKRLEADDDYRLFYVDGKVYLVNNKGKIQKATGDGKKYDDIENKKYSGKDDVIVVTNKNGVVESVTFGDDVKEENSEKSELTATITWPTSEDAVLDDKCSEYVTVPFIALYDGVYTYKSINENGTVSIKETWIKDAN
jgi:glucan-binding YG repeat protein